MHSCDDQIFLSCLNVLRFHDKKVGLQQLADRFQQKPEPLMCNEQTSSYSFSNYGVEVIFSETKGHCKAVAFLINTPSTRKGSSQPFCQSLFNGVLPTDSISDVQAKIHESPQLSTSTEGPTLRYDYADHNVSFYFDKEGKQLSLVLLKSKRAKPA